MILKILRIAIEGHCRIPSNYDNSICINANVLILIHLLVLKSISTAYVPNMNLIFWEIGELTDCATHATVMSLSVHICLFLISMWLGRRQMD